jgi:Conserved in the green lineage and diatoms 27
MMMIVHQALIGALALTASAGVSAFFLQAGGPNNSRIVGVVQQPNRMVVKTLLPFKSEKNSNYANDNSDESSSSYSSTSSSLRPETSFGSEAVPEAQRPINEYLDVTSQPLFDWANRDSGDLGLLTRLGIVYGIVFAVVCYPISGATFTQEGYLWQKLAAANVGATILLLFVMIRIYTGWGYIGSRLKSKVIEYEETGWYDGDWERKTEAELLRDRLLYNGNVKPVLDRLQRFTAGTVLAAVLSVASFQLAMMNSPPLFDQYDPVLLERLRYDDTLADTAAQQSGGKPAYCDSRYYRAVANGGQGCS